MKAKIKTAHILICLLLVSIISVNICYAESQIPSFDTSVKKKGGLIKSLEDGVPEVFNIKWGTSLIDVYDFLFENGVECSIDIDDGFHSIWAHSFETNIMILNGIGVCSLTCSFSLPSKGEKLEGICIEYREKYDKVYKIYEDRYGKPTESDITNEYVSHYWGSIEDGQSIEFYGEKNENQYYNGNITEVWYWSY